MHTVCRFLAPASPCGYLREQTWRLEYELVDELSPREYLERMEQGWRRFGRALFRPRCPACSACRSLRVVVDRFQPNRSQRRVRKANAGRIALRIGEPSVSRDKLDLYDRYHAYQSATKEWPAHAGHDVHGYMNSFVDNPLPTQEWCYYERERLVAVGYVDDLPGALSAIYCFYEPELRGYSLGTWNVLCLIQEAARRGLAFVYLGYHVASCQSMEYKTHFVPHQILGSDGQWSDAPH
jgi:arginine-tRNA-protein transferase